MSAYSSAVIADSPFVYYPDASAAPWVDYVSAQNIAVTGATPNVTGPLLNDDTKAFSFDGVDDFGQVALDLSDTSVVTVEMWLWWDVFDTNFDLAYEFTAGWDGNNGSLVFDPNRNSGDIGIGHRGDVGLNEKTYTRPSAAAWHHYATVHDFSQAAADEITVYIDGAPVSPLAQPQANNNTAASFASATLNAMCRNGASLFGGGDMAHLAIYKSTLPAARVLAHFNASSGAPEQTAIWPFNRQGPF